jgi:hypothetical protein
MCIDPSLLQPMIPTLLKAAAAAVAVLIGMFFFTYLPQVAVLAFVTGPLGTSFPFLLEQLKRIFY